MTHLTPDQLVDALEGQTTLRASVADHLATCEHCQAELASIAEALGEVKSWAMPEPSPLFWEHLSRRVRAATSEEMLPLARSWAEVWGRTWRPLAAVVAATGALALMFMLRSAHVSAPGAATPGAAVAMTGASVAPLDESNDEALNVVAVLAQDLRTDDVQQIARPSADAAGAAIENLTPAQQAELVKLIKSQLGGAE